MSIRFRDSIGRRLSGAFRRRTSNASVNSISSGPTSINGSSSEVMAYSLNDTTKQVWKLPSGQVCIHQDLPRLIDKIKVVAKDGASYFDGEKNTSPHVTKILEFILALNSQFPDDPMRAADDEIKEVFQNHVNKPEGDVGEQLLGFFLSGVIHEKSRLMQLLKFVAHDVAAPSIHRLRDTFFEKFPYRGVNGSWGLQFFIDEDEVVITHSKSEQSVDQELGNKFDFSWKCSIVWIPAADRLQVTINLIHLGFDDEMKFRTRKEIRDLLDTFVDEAGAYRLIWDRPLKRQPVHKDIARLCSRLQIISHTDGKVLDYVDNETVPSHQIVYEILEAITKYTKEDFIATEVKKYFYEFVHADGDLSEQVLRFLLSKKTDDNTFPEKSATVRILKCINQELLFPAVMTLRANIYEQYPFKDMKKGWTVIIRFGENGFSVSHLKKEQSHHGDEQYFDFEWVLKCEMSYHDTEYFVPSMKIVNFNWDTRSSAETRKKVLDGLMPFIEQNMMYERILKKERQKMTLHSDVIRFLRPEAILIKKKNDILYKYSGASDDVREAEKILVMLAQQLNDEASLKVLTTQFAANVRGGSGLSEQLKTFFSDPKFFQENSPLITLIKGLSSDMYFPAYLKLRTAFFNVFPFKDVKGSGRLIITFNPPEDVSKGAPICQVTHIKREQTTSDSSTQYFEFDWQLTMNFTNLETKSLEVAVNIVEYAFGDHTTQDIKIDAVAAWSPFLVDSIKDRNPLMMMSGKKTMTGRTRKKYLESQKSGEQSSH